MAEIPELRRFARRATASITSAGERTAASEELYEHALSRYEDARAAGLDHTAAIAVVVDGLGDPSALSADLGRAHRQQLTVTATVLLVVAGVAFVGFLWGLIALLVAADEQTGLILLGLLALVAIAATTIVILGRRAS